MITHRHPLNLLTTSLLNIINARVAAIAKFIDKPACFYYAGPLVDPYTQERIVEKLRWPFDLDDTMSDSDWKEMRALVPHGQPNAHKQPFVFWLPKGEPIAHFFEKLPFVQIVSPMDKVNHPDGFRHDVGMSIGASGIRISERKDWYDQLGSYMSGHYQGQRATMSRSTIGNCHTDFMAEYPSWVTDGSLAVQHGDGTVRAVGGLVLTPEMVEHEFGMNDAIESTTLHTYGIHTRRPIHMFHTVSLLLAGIHKILEKGDVRYQNRAAGLPTCFTPDSKMSASDGVKIGKVGHKTDLQARDRFVLSFCSWMTIAKHALHALFDTYKSHEGLIKAYLDCPEDQRDLMLMNEVSFKDLATYNMFDLDVNDPLLDTGGIQVKKGGGGGGGGAARGSSAGAKQAPIKRPFGKMLSTRIHRFLFGLPDPVTKARGGRKERTEDD